MKRSFLARVSGAVVALALGTTTLAVVGAASSASAAGTCASRTTLKVGTTTVQYGDYNYLNADVAPANCEDTFISSGAGRVTIQRSLDNGRTWQGLKAGTSPSYVYLSGAGVISASGLYRAVYSGGTESTSFEPTTFNASVSPVVRINVIRKLDIRDKSTRSKSVGRFKLSPTTGLVGKKLVFQVKKGKKWKKYKKVKVKASGVFKVSFKNSRKGIKYRLVVPAAGNLSAFTYGPITATRR